MVGTPPEIKRGFSGIRVIDISVREARGLQVIPHADIRGCLLDLVGEDNVAAVVDRDPTLEEAYLNLLG